jgi:hypothetical protein
MSLMLSLALVAGGGCKETPTTDWSEQAASPDGAWIASASNQRGGGMGGAYNDVTVRLKRKMEPNDGITILSFSNESQVADLKMDWVTSTHLNVTYPSYATLDFQAIKCAGIDISVVEVQRDCPTPPRLRTHSPQSSR